MEAPILAGIIMILIGVAQFLDRARIALIWTRAMGQYWGNRSPDEEPPDAAVAPARGYFTLSSLLFIVFGVVAIISGINKG